MGDIHGQGALLKHALQAIRERIPHCDCPVNVILLGDLIDRGPDIFPVLRQVEEARQDFGSRVFVVRGNHERAFENYLKGELELREMEEWILQFGGKDTSEACGLDFEQAIKGYRKGQWQPANALVERLFRFCSECLDFVELGGVAFVHEPETGERLLKTGRRGPLLGYVHGHIIVPEVTVLPERIALDVGSYTNGAVAVLQFVKGAVWYCKISAR